MNAVVDRFLVPSPPPSGWPLARSVRPHTAEDDDLAMLLEGVTRGEETAMTELHRRTERRMRTMAQRLLRDRDLTAEAVQDAYVQIWRHAQTYSRDRSPPLTWMLKIARNRSLDLLRRRKREVARRAVSDDAPDYESIASETAGPEQLALVASEMRALHGALSSLGEREQRAIFLAFVHEHTDTEIAAAMQVPLGTVKSWIRRSLVRLRATRTSMRAPVIERDSSTVRRWERAREVTAHPLQGTGHGLEAG
jgi:RNA polymerase sigma-70 factor (ECF subfamily)